jgi:hypothetical protein
MSPLRGFVMNQPISVGCRPRLSADAAARLRSEYTVNSKSFACQALFAMRMIWCYSAMIKNSCGNGVTSWPTTSGLKFLGMNLQQNGRRWQQSSISRFTRRLRRQRWLWKRRIIKPERIRLSLKATIGYARFANAQGLLSSIWPRVRFGRGL